MTDYKVIYIAITLAILAHIEVKSLRSDNNPVLLRATRVVHAVEHHFTKHSVAFRINTFFSVRSYQQSFHEGYYLFCYIFMYFRQSLIVEIVWSNNFIYRVEWG